MMVMLHTLALFVLIACDGIFAHPTIYPHIGLKRGNKNRVQALPNPPPGILSYHIHITYTLFHAPVCILSFMIDILFCCCFRS